MSDRSKLADAPHWRCKIRSTGGSWDGPLVAYWEVELDPISDDFTPLEIPATELLKKWLTRVAEAHSNQLVPIHWYVDSPGLGKFERMPFQMNHLGGQEPDNFLTFYTWPESVATGESLNWLALSVVDKLWNSSRADKGGFIQEATGWKPSVLQPYVYLASLASILPEG